MNKLLINIHVFKLHMGIIMLHNYLKGFIVYIGCRYILLYSSNFSMLRVLMISGRIRSVCFENQFPWGNQKSSLIYNQNNLFQIITFDIAFICFDIWKKSCIIITPVTKEWSNKHQLIRNNINYTLNVYFKQKIERERGREREIHYWFV